MNLIITFLISEILFAWRMIQEDVDGVVIATVLIYMIGFLVIIHSTFPMVVS